MIPAPERIFVRISAIELNACVTPPTNLTIDRPLPLLELTACENDLPTPDVCIRIAHVDPDGVLGGQQLGPYLWVNPSRLWLQSARLSAGSAFGALLFQHAHPVLHGNAFRIGTSAWSASAIPAPACRAFRKSNSGATWPTS
jgi:hypothetical protein